MDERTALLQESSASHSRPSTDHAETRSSDCEPTTKCQVCNTIIPIVNKEKQLVVKCPSCGEATPIKGPPTGKQYVRCQCNCLLICKSTATRVGCPREDCLRVINLNGPNASGYQAGDVGREGIGGSGGSGGGVGAGTFPNRGGLRVTCGNCHRPFSIPTPQSYRPNAFGAAFVNRLVNCLSGGAASNVSGLIAARCPQCRKVTSIGQAYARTRWVGYLILTLIFLVIAIGVTFGTTDAAKSYHGLYFLWSVLYLVVLNAHKRTGASCDACLGASTPPFPHTRRAISPLLSSLPPSCVLLPSLIKPQLCLLLPFSV
ncbi:Type I phosphatidylinositol 4,5-bisphosphate 4-phosphatase-B [Echinococcus granulosus]|uniref:Phosphatidylinositol-4,5-bisphosphate 4-phosphatase n=1 Tax=Echinococcus granulosus TaxID=6210 RepID=A0A068WXW5_ECHGR|nr:Type I phosphatidylinositol 4,5-bisphosphate 4-phosphatase-B [Echinococcus granulosus]CDS24712.1 Transmembrane protein 55A B [Echinococcus granulosus]